MCMAFARMIYRHHASAKSFDSVNKLNLVAKLPDMWISILFHRSVTHTKRERVHVKYTCLQI